MNVGYSILNGPTGLNSAHPSDPGVNFALMDPYSKMSLSSTMPPAVAASYAVTGPVLTSGSNHNSADTTPTPESNRSSSRKSSRLTWKPEEDVAMLTIILEQRLLVRETTQYRKFWDGISEQLVQMHGILRNTRQCRDRFNLLYAKGARNVTNDVEVRSERDNLLREIVTVFRLSQKGHIVLQELGDSNENESNFDSHTQMLQQKDSNLDCLSDTRSEYEFINTQENTGPSTGTSAEWKSMSEMVGTLMNCTNNLALEIQGLGERFRLLSEQMEYLQKRLDYALTVNPAGLRGPSQDQYYAYAYQPMDRPK